MSKTTQSAPRLITANGKREHYYLSPGYRYRDTSENFDDRPNRARWQDHVYAAAHRIAVDHGCRTILDIGCGSGFKLMKYFSGFTTFGIDRPEVIPAVREVYPDRAWRPVTLNEGTFPAADIYICSDVIEHIREPAAFLKQIGMSPFRFLVISTPAREVLVADGRRAWLGPPDNPAHHFEWTMGEFNKLLSDYVTVIEHSYQYNGEYCQIAVARQRG